MKVYQGWSRGRPLLSQAIRAFDGVMWTGQWWPAYFNHTYLVFDWEDSGPRILFESRDLHGIGFEPAEKLDTSADVERHLEYCAILGGLDADTAWAKAKKLRGKGYDVGHLLVLYAALRLEKEGFATRWWHKKPDGRYTCNEAVQTVLLAAGVDPNEGVCDASVSTPERQFLRWHGMPSRRWAQINGL